MFRSIRTIRNIPRLKDISFILIKHGFHQVASYLGTPIRYRLRRLLPQSPPPLTQSERLRLAFQELGPLFVKLGQLIANRPDLFPARLVDEFAKLEDRVAPLPFAEIRQVVEEELGTEPRRYYRSIEEQPLASASVAQIHRATTRDGRQVVLKVQKPGVRRTIERDLEILAVVGEALSRSGNLEVLDPEVLVAEVRRAIERELNFNFERNAQERIRARFTGDSVLVVPRTFAELSSRRVLAMEHLEGPTVRHARLSAEEGRRVARECTRILFEMIFRDGFFHADPHPSNIIVLGGGRLGWVDFGAIGLFNDEMRHRLVRLLRVLLARDYYKLARQVVRLGRVRGEISVFELSQDLATRLDPFFGLELREIDLAELFSTVFELAREYRISMAPGFVIMTRTLVLMEGLAHRLDPTFDTMLELEPLGKRFLLERLQPENIIEEAGERTAELITSLWEYPHHFGEILRKMAHGRFHVDTHVQGIETLNQRLESSSNRVVQALIVSSLLVSSSLIMGLQEGPKLGGFSVLGLAGYLFAGLIGIRILFGILRH